MKPASGVVSPSGSTSIDIPRGGRPLVTANATPAARSRCTAAIVAGVSCLSESTSVPSTSLSMSWMGVSVTAFLVLDCGERRYVPHRGEGSG